LNDQTEPQSSSDVAPGFMDAANRSLSEGLLTYTIGLALAALLTAAAFYLVHSRAIWAPGIAVALLVLAVAQIGVHLVFFLHLTTAPDNTNNALALAFGVLIVTLVVGGSLWIMSRLNENMVPGHRMPQMDLARLAESGGLRARGVVGPISFAQARARAPGVIEAVQCDVQMHVKAGQLCAKIDPRPYQTAVDRSVDALKSAEAQLQSDSTRRAEAQAALEKQQASGARRGEIRQLRKSAQAAQARVKRGEDTVTRSKNALAAAQAELGRTDIDAPIDGIVVSRTATLGAKVTPQEKTPLFVIAPEEAPVSAAMSREEADRVELGDKVMFAVESLPGQEFPGVVTAIEAARQAPGGTGEALVRIKVENRAEALKPGMTGTVRILSE
jgi:cytochrome o ubiquinol oxidase subunit IV